MFFNALAKISERLDPKWLGLWPLADYFESYANCQSWQHVRCLGEKCSANLNMEKKIKNASLDASSTNIADFFEIYTQSKRLKVTETDIPILKFVLARLVMLFFFPQRGGLF